MAGVHFTALRHLNYLNFDNFEIPFNNFVGELVDNQETHCVSQ